MPAIWTVRGPEVASSGTLKEIEVSLQLLMVGAVVLPKKFTVLLLCTAPKPAPEIVTGAAVPLLPNGPVEGETDVIVGDCSTVNGRLLLLTPPTTTVTVPLVALLGTCAITLGALN